MDVIDTIYLDDNQVRSTIVWDLGRRCNYDCTYCTGWMHSTTAPFNKLEQYKKTAAFINEYYEIYGMFSNLDFRPAISFTGGEPTINPDFFPLVDYMRETYPHIPLSVTTNGTWGHERCKKLAATMKNITISYHAEGSDKQKELFKKNVLWLKANYPKPIRINVMMHVDHWDECVALIEDFLKPNGVNYIPRVIGDDGMKKSEWFEDIDGAMRRTTHVYNAEQLDWMKKHWKKKNDEVGDTKTKITSEVKAPQDMGRMCCGGRCMKVKDKGETRDTMFIPQTNFEGWKCLINWFFLHIEEDKDAIYHHQTCMARFPEYENAPNQVKFTQYNFPPERGPICSISNCDDYLNWLENRMMTKTLPVITCPNTFCGCGICVPKSNNQADFDEILKKYTTIEDISA